MAQQQPTNKQEQTKTDPPRKIGFVATRLETETPDALIKAENPPFRITDWASI